MAIQNVDAKTLKKWMDNNEVVIVDVREPEEYAVKSIPGSILIPLSQLNLKNLPNRGDKKMVIHCGVGKRSHTACEKLFTEDPTLELYNLEGGINAWSSEGYPVNNNAPAATPAATPSGMSASLGSMSAEQQYQVIMGGIILIGSLFALLFSPIWFLIPAIAGGLMFYNGFTGTTHIADFIRKMPWNK